MFKDDPLSTPMPKGGGFGQSLAGDSRRGFSLVELLVSIGVLLVVAMILLPAVQIVRERGRATQCMQNLRQLWQASKAFSMDRNGRFCSLNIEKYSTHPLMPGFRDYLGYRSELLQDTTYSCPQAQAGKDASGWSMHRSYSVSRFMVANWNTSGSGTVVSGALEYANRVKHPSRALYLADGVPGGVTASGKGINYATNVNYANSQKAGYIHAGHCNGVFLDGHVAALTPKDLDRPKENALWGGEELD